MWTLLSFTGRFDVAFLENAIARGAKGPPRMPGERTEQQKQQVRDAQMGRARLRRGAMLERLQERLSHGNKAKGKGKRKARPLNPKQLRVLQEYQSGDLRRQANNLTMISGHGRLKKGPLLRGHRWMHWRLREDCAGRLGVTRPRRFRRRRVTRMVKWRRFLARCSLASKKT